MTVSDTTSPAPAARFWDRIADNYAKKPVSDEAAYQNKLRITREHLAPEMEVLEFGCGTGSTALAHAPFVQSILATDLSPRMIEIARGKAEAAAVANVTFRQQTIEDLDAPAASFDAVLGLSILHLLEDPEAVIAKIHRLLKPGGVFVTSTACLKGSMGWFRLIAPIGRAFGLLPLVRFLSVAELEESLTRHGFRIEQTLRAGSGPSVFIVATKPV